MKLPKWLSKPPVTGMPEPPVIDTAVLGSGTLEVVVMARIRTVFVYGDGADSMIGWEAFLREHGWFMVALVPDKIVDDALPRGGKSINEIAGIQ